MIKMIYLYILILFIILRFYLPGIAQNPLKYTYLFRNTILSKSKTFELAPVLRGRVYYPRYFYIPSLKQYIVYSDQDETGPFTIYEQNRKDLGKAYVLLNEDGNIVQKVETHLNFSSRSGCFYGHHTYIPFFETGKSDTIPYHKIHNEKLDIGSKAFEKLFQELYVTSEYIEFINLRVSGDDNHQAGVIFKRQGKLEILLSGLRDSHMNCKFQEDITINCFDDYYEPDISNSERFPQSEPALKMIPLRTKRTNPFVYWRTGFNRTFHLKKYGIEYSSGWRGIMKIGIIPISVPGEVSGIAYVRFNVKGQSFKIKIIDVEKISFLPAYHLGLRSFELPSNINTKNSLVFMESIQNSGDNRLGGGVFVVRRTTNKNPSSDIPADIAEKQFNTLPYTLQVALLDPEQATSLKIMAKNVNSWIPELERLKNLKRLEMTTGASEIPDQIATFSKLETLTISYGDITSVSPKLGKLSELQTLDLYANKLTEFPAAVLQLKKLQSLNVGANYIDRIPEEICKLDKLKHMEIIVTNITTLPECMIEMKNLYIRADDKLKKNLPAAYQHLFDYGKQE